MTIVANHFAPSNVQVLARLLEANDGKVWFSAGEFSGTDLWFFDPTPQTFTLVQQISSGFPFDSINDVATDVAGNQWNSYRSGGFGPVYFQQFNDAGVQGANVALGANAFIFAAGNLVGSFQSGMTYTIHGDDAYTGTRLWTTSTHAFYGGVDCVGPDGEVYGRGDANDINKVNPTTGVVTALLSGSAGWGKIASDGTNLWVYDYSINEVVKFDTSGTILASYSLGASPTYVVVTYRPHDNKVYVTGSVATTTMPVWSIDHLGTVTLELASMFTTSVDRLAYDFITYSDGKTMYVSVTGSREGVFSDANLIQLYDFASQQILMM